MGGANASNVVAAVIYVHTLGYVTMREFVGDSVGVVYDALACLLVVELPVACFGFRTDPVPTRFGLFDL
jgi:hypothetical protein